MLENPYQQYKQISIMTASPGELTLMLYDGCLKQIGLANKFIDSHEKKNIALQKAQAILTELMSTLDMDYEISYNLFHMYEFIFRLLVHANIKNSKEDLDHASALLSDLRQAWAETVNKHRRGLHNDE
ncbi:MAG TPA: flagellar export chaperone FliS [Clostridiales bacterium]|nr:flagellar export chaperone FliS [Clostridiales bacterium]